MSMRMTATAVAVTAACLMSLPAPCPADTPALDAPGAPRSDGCVLNVDFENYFDNTYPLLNAGIRWLGFFPADRYNQDKVEVVKDPSLAYAGGQGRLRTCRERTIRRPGYCSRAATMPPSSGARR